MPEDFSKSEIIYRIGNFLYVNLTNRCTNACYFCERNKEVSNPEPSVEELISSIEKQTEYEEVILCGYGEALFRLEEIKEIAAWLKSKGAKVRLTTNGHGNLIHGRDITPELGGLVDTVFIRLNGHDRESHNQVCSPVFGENSFEAILDFGFKCRQLLAEVVFTVVEVPEIDLRACRKLADRMGIAFRVVGKID